MICRALHRATSSSRCLLLVSAAFASSIIAKADFKFKLECFPRLAHIFGQRESWRRVYGMACHLQQERSCLLSAVVVSSSAIAPRSRLICPPPTTYTALCSHRRGNILLSHAYRSCVSGSQRGIDFSSLRSDTHRYVNSTRVRESAR